MRARSVWIPVSLLTAALAVGCGGGGDTPAETATSEAPAGAPAAAGGGGGNTVDPAKAGNISGKVVLEGTPPAEEVIRMNADPVCMKEASGEQKTTFFLVGDGGTLGNVFVYVKDGLGNYKFPPPAESVTLDQKGCRYHPHVFGVQVGQPLEIINSDPTLHNVHAMPKNNTEFNTGQPIQGMKTNHTFTAAEVMVPFKCDVHGWMNAYAGVVPHPFYAVTGNNGTFQLEGVPAGTYTVEAWHEKLGAQTQSVTVGEGGTADVSFTFKAS